MGSPDLVRFGASGSVHVADSADHLPTDATTALDGGFSDLGLISEAGATLKRSITTTDVKAWGAGVVRSSVTDSPFSVEFVCLETNEATLELWLGTSDTGTGEVVEFAIDGQAAIVEKVVVIEWSETIEGTTYPFRLVMPRASVETTADVAVNSNNPTEYGLTLKGGSDTDGKAGYLYTTADAVGKVVGP